MQNGYSADTGIEGVFVKEQLFPFLEAGSKIVVENEKVTIEVIYDVLLPMTSNQTQLFNNPLYLTGITGRHNRPDICINIYSKKSKWYIGSYIIECKYRKLNAFWGGSTWSSKEQIIAYHNDSKSNLFFNGYFDGITSSRPVHQVLVFTPDVFEQRDYSDNKVSLITFKPTENRDTIRNACIPLFSAISEQVETADVFFDRVSHP